MRRGLILVAGLAVVAIVVAAVGGGDPTTAAPTTEAGIPATSRPPQPGTTLPPAPTGTTIPPTVTVAPIPDAPLGLDPDIAQLTAMWPTEWAISTIDLGELKLGIPAFDPRDRIRPIDAPTYESIESANEWLVDREIGVMLELDSVARFFPLRILTSHEVVNDEVDGVPYVVTYCPLCNTAVAFDRRVEGEVLRFGVSGLLRNSDLVMWDDRTTSLWQQITGEGIVGSFAGTQLDILPTATVRWGDFKASHPDGEALSQDTGFGFNYGSNSYVGYSNRTAPFNSFFDAELDERFPALSRVVGVRVGDLAKAYPFSVMANDRAVNDEIGGVAIAVWWAPTDSADNFDGAQVGSGASIGTGIAFLREVDGQVLTFAADGDEAFVDTETGSTWTLFGEAIAGPLVGTQLELAIHQNEFWFAWAAFNGGAPVHGT